MRILALICLVALFLVSCSPGVAPAPAPSPEPTSTPEPVPKPTAESPQENPQEINEPEPEPTPLAASENSSAPEATPAPEPAPVLPPAVALQYREIHSFTTEAVSDNVSIINQATRYGFDLPDEITTYPHFALYTVIQNIDNAAGTFTVHYSLCTADKEAAIAQQGLAQRTPQEEAALDKQFYEGDIELYLEPGEIGLAICPTDGVLIDSDRVPFGHSHSWSSQQS